MAKVNIPKVSPHDIREASWEEHRRDSKAKYVPRQPKEGETLMVVGRPQVGPYTFLEFARGDLLSTTAGRFVVVVTKPGFTRSGSGWKKWEQLVVVRPATEAEWESTADQRKAMDEASQARSRAFYDM